MELRTFCVNLDAKDARKSIVAAGQMLAAEDMRRAFNCKRDLAAKFDRQLTDVEYGRLNEEHRKALIKYAGRISYNSRGKEWSGDINANALANDTTFWKVMSSVVDEVIAPIPGMLIPEAFGPLAKVVTVAPNETYTVRVQSGEAFIFEDTAWGAERSVPVNKLYADEFTLNPRPRATATAFHYRELFSEEFDMGALYNAIFRGLYNKIYALYAQAMKSAFENESLIPSYLKVAGYTTANLAKLANNVAKYNYLNRHNIAVMGLFPAVNKVIPVGEHVETFTSGLGEGWMRTGVMTLTSGMPIYEIPSVIDETTRYTTRETLLPEDVLMVVPMNTTAPIYIAMERGGSVTTVIEPSNTANGDMLVNMTTAIDVKPVFLNGIGLITNVV